MADDKQLLQRIASLITWIYGYAEALTQSGDPKIADIGRDLMRALREASPNG